MTRVGQRCFIILFFGFLILLPLGVSAKSKLDESEATLSRANNQYFEALSSGQAQTEQEKKALYDKIVGPALTDMNKNIEEANQQFLGKHFKLVSREELAKALERADREKEQLKPDELGMPSPYLRSVVDNFFPEFKNKNPDKNLPPGLKPAPESTYKVETKTKPGEVVVDAKDVPKELEFPGASPPPIKSMKSKPTKGAKQKAVASPSPSPWPSVRQETN